VPQMSFHSESAAGLPLRVNERIPRASLISRAPTREFADRRAGSCNRLKVALLVRLVPSVRGGRGGPR
jgi:hypothetical protein